MFASLPPKHHNDIIFSKTVWRRPVTQLYTSTDDIIGHKLDTINCIGHEVFDEYGLKVRKESWNINSMVNNSQHLKMIKMHVDYLAFAKLT